MYRPMMLFFALMFSPVMAAAQQPCTSEARPVVNELYRHMLERNADARSNYWVQQLLEGRERWTDTGLNVREGQMIMFDARGTVRLGPNENDIAGVEGTLSGRRDSNAPIDNQPVGGLIARIGNTPMFYVGDRNTIRAPAAGRLYLGVNDNSLADNAGDFQVVVDVQP